MTTQTQKKILEFLELPYAAKALRGLRSSARMTLNVNGEAFLLYPEGGRYQVVPVPGDTKADLQFYLDQELFLKLFARAREPDMDIGRFGVLLFQSVLEGKEQGKLRFAINASVPSLLLRGYFTVLLAGGSTVMRFLSQHGVGSLAQIKKIISKG